jgi:hypothetical protein
MNIVNNTVHIGLKTPVRVLHASDTHITRADLRDCLRKVDLGASRAHDFPYAEEDLLEITRISHEMGLPIMYTGDLMDFVSIANLEGAKAFADANDVFVAAGNHEFAQYLGVDREDAEYRNQSLAKVQACFKNNIRMSSRIIGGLNFIALDNGYYKFDPEHLDFIKEQVKLGLPIVLMFHTPLYERAFYDESIRRTPGCAFLTGVPDELRECYPNPKVSEYQAADAITLEVMDYIANEPLVKAILTGHMHFDYDSVYANRIPQLCTACRTLRVVEFV